MGVFLIRKHGGCFMKLAGKDVRVMWMFLLLAGVLAFGACQAETAEIRIGQLDMERVYNSYPGIQTFQAEMQNLQTEFQQAQEAGDQNKLMELQQQFQTKQDEFHAEFKSDLNEATAAVGEREDVHLIVAEVIYHADNAEVVDVSEAMIEEINGEEPEPVFAPQP
jgi:Skp family chaperone for outer membrane proteins